MNYIYLELHPYLQILITDFQLGCVHRATIITPSYIFKHSKMTVSHVGISSWIYEMIRDIKMHLLTFFALLYCMHFNYALFSELIGSFAKTVGSGNVRPDSDVLLDVYVVIYPGDIRGSLLRTSIIMIWMAYSDAVKNLSHLKFGAYIH